MHDPLTGLPNRGYLRDRIDRVLSLAQPEPRPFCALKIDRAFVNALDKDANTSSTTAVAAILALARALSIDVVAEGIETEIQRMHAIPIVRFQSCCADVASDFFVAATCRNACSNASGGCPPEIKWRSLTMVAGTDWMPRDT